MNYTDSLAIPRAKLAALAINGTVTLYLGSDVPANALSQSSDPAQGLRLSPVTLAYPLMFCFLKATKSGIQFRDCSSWHHLIRFAGPNFGIYLNRPESYYFKETGIVYIVKSRIE